MSATTTSTPKHTLYDVPVSNNGARCRIILYKKNLPSEEVSIASPSTLGGLKDPAYLKLNPQGKMPLLTISTTSDDDNIMVIPESDTICRYLLSHYRDVGPSFEPDHVKSNLVARLHDMYLTTIQGCLYKAVPPFGMYGCRKDAIAEFRRQLHVIDDILSVEERIDEEDGPYYLFGSQVTLADATLFPTMVFATFMMPKFGIAEAEVLPSNIARWYRAVTESDSDFAKVQEEIIGALTQWDSNGRWDPIYHAGIRDTAPSTLFDKIISKEIPADIVREDDYILAFRDINPAAPGHVLVIPKDRMGLTKLTLATKEHEEMLGRLLVAAADIARDETLGGFTANDGARIVINDGRDGGQEIDHLHVHVLGGRQMTWPPG